MIGNSPSEDEKAVASAVEMLRVAMLKADRNELDRLCAAELSYGHSGGTLETKGEFIEANCSGYAVWEDLAFSALSVKVVEGVALVRHMLVGNTKHGGQVHAVKIGVLLVWVKKGASWALLARQAFKF